MVNCSPALVRRLSETQTVTMARSSCHWPERNPWTSPEPHRRSKQRCSRRALPFSSSLLSLKDGSIQGAIELPYQAANAGGAAFKRPATCRLGVRLCATRSGDCRPATSRPLFQVLDDGLHIFDGRLHRSDSRHGTGTPSASCLGGPAPRSGEEVAPSISLDFTLRLLCQIPRADSCPRPAGGLVESRQAVGSCMRRPHCFGLRHLGCSL
ncbi:hypothetical protein CALVIDRAFT_395753 [Calocera viscosa TUFC12733]|uniref:Uncharacterized protein n=1 Tax=Calocera viscosa (strain TUFC12733) TaxID=1330018 RepID=A0A167GA47_CALVF|nr:hypothetical protein CALVIDRAFT_395753 [Calocera viscosa TUFC12733]